MTATKRVKAGQNRRCPEHPWQGRHDNVWRPEDEYADELDCYRELVAWDVDRGIDPDDTAYVDFARSNEGATTIRNSIKNRPGEPIPIPNRNIQRMRR